MNAKRFNNELYQHWSTLKSLAIGIIKDPMVADDILQIAFVKALTTKSLPKNKANILPWLKTIVKNTTLDVIKKQKQTQQKEIDLHVDREIQNSHFDSSACNCILKLLSHLSPADQKLLIALDINHIPLKTLSNSMSISKNTLKVRRYRARQRLKKAVMAVCHMGTSEECINCDCD
tara:strand:+ start:127 stop:654 length:528 start_codon:yes stop_codon:yes gene_type:complete